MAVTLTPNMITGAVLDMGIFVILEGLDASGKTTVSNMLKEALAKFSVCTIVKRDYFDDLDDTQYPNRYIGDFSKKLNELTWKQPAEKLDFNIPVNTLGFIHAAWYEMFYSKHILHLKDKYDIVIVDGWWYKTFARIMTTSNQHYELIVSLAPFLPLGDMTFFLNVQPQIAWERRQGRFSSFELGLQKKKKTGPLQEQFISFQKEVKENILKILPNDFIEVDTSSIGINQVVDDVANRINQNT